MYTEFSISLQTNEIGKVEAYNLIPFRRTLRWIPILSEKSTQWTTIFLTWSKGYLPWDLPESWTREVQAIRFQLQCENLGRQECQQWLLVYRPFCFASDLVAFLDEEPWPCRWILGCSSRTHPMEYPEAREMVIMIFTSINDKGTIAKLIYNIFLCAIEPKVTDFLNRTKKLFGNKLQPHELDS